jgi:hypothetical protein
MGWEKELAEERRRKREKRKKDFLRKEEGLPAAARAAPMLETRRRCPLALLIIRRNLFLRLSL